LTTGADPAQLALSRGVFLLNFACLHENRCLSALPPLGHEIWAVILAMFANVVLWGGAGVLIDSSRRPGACSHGW
jgi:hypothetical protein